MTSLFRNRAAERAAAEFARAAGYSLYNPYAAAAAFGWTSPHVIPSVAGAVRTLPPHSLVSANGNHAPSVASVNFQDSARRISEVSPMMSKTLSYY